MISLFGCVPFQLWTFSRSAQAKPSLLSQGPHHPSRGQLSGDLAENVRENRRRIFTALGLDSDHIFFQQQVHGDHITRVPEEWSHPSPYSAKEAVSETDAMITTQPGVCLVGKAADCLPLLSPPAS